MTKQQAAIRIRVLTALILAIFLLITYRLYQVQIVNGEEFRHKAGSQYVRTTTTDFDRGTIYIKDNVGTKFPVASVASGYILAINPSILNNPTAAEQIYAVLKPSERADYSEAQFKEYFSAQAADKNDPYQEILNRLSKATAESITLLDIDGVDVYGERWRHYPASDLMSHVIGFTSYTDGVEREGTYGLERYYEDKLRRNQSSIFTNFFAEAFTTAKTAVGDSLPSDLYLTIDRSIQIELENTLNDTKDDWGSKQVAGIVMDPKTGAIIAMAATPSFDLNNFSSVSDPVVFVNPLVENVYEMGSIMKPLTMAYALDSNAVNRHTTYNDTGKLKIDSATISNYDGGARGIVPMQEILNQSLNVGTAFLLRSMTSNTFKDYFIKSDLDKATGIDLPNEASPLTGSLLSSPRQIEYVTASYGQGFAVTPIAMARALALLANDGQLPSPYVVERIQHELGTWSDMRKQDSAPVVSPQSAKTTTDMLVTVVDEALRGGDVSLKNYSIAAKTGTAQIANRSGKYREDAYLHTFFGYFPAYHPEYLIFLLNEEPVGARYASETLTNPFMDLTKFLINYQNIEPDR